MTAQPWSYDPPAEPLDAGRCTAAHISARLAFALLRLAAWLAPRQHPSGIFLRGRLPQLESPLLDSLNSQRPHRLSPLVVGSIGVATVWQLVDSVIPGQQGLDYLLTLL